MYGWRKKKPHSPWVSFNSRDQCRAENKRTKDAEVHNNTMQYHKLQQCNVIKTWTFVLEEFFIMVFCWWSKHSHGSAWKQSGYYMCNPLDRSKNTLQQIKRNIHTNLQLKELQHKWLSGSLSFLSLSEKIELCHCCLLLYCCVTDLFSKAHWFDMWIYCVLVYVLQSTFFCECEDGYTGIFCEEFDACHHRPCRNNGTCTDVRQGGEGRNFTCSCPAGACVQCVFHTILHGLRPIDVFILGLCEKIQFHMCGDERNENLPLLFREHVNKNKRAGSS